MNQKLDEEIHMAKSPSEAASVLMELGGTWISPVGKLS